VGKPDGLLVVPPERELAFLHPLPVERIWGVGDVTAAKLHTCGIRTVGEIVQMGEAGMVSVLGPFAGRHIYALALARDPRPVRVGHRRGSVGAQRALGRFRGTPAALDEVAVGLVDRVTRRMRKGGRAGRTVVLRLRFADFTRVTRSRTLGRATDNTEEILAAVRGLIAANTELISERGITLLGISVGNLDGDGAVQLELPFAGAPPAALDAALDGVRAKFGSSSLTRAVLLNKDQGISLPVLDE
jgi:DNA polymerase-4